MGKLNKHILVLVLLLPVLVMLAHDIIPHHHHETHSASNISTMSHAHVRAEHSHACAHHQTQNLGHSHEKTETECCAFGNLRFFKNIKFQVYLSHIILNIVAPDDSTPVKYYVSNYIQVPEPNREAYGLRGPPLA